MPTPLADTENGLTMTLLQRSRTSLARTVLGEDNYRRVLRVINDRRQKPRVGKVRFGDLRRIEPICREYGFERGRPIDRFYIENFLETNSHLITGSVLEIGERTYTEAFGEGVTRSDMLHVADVEDATYVADLTDAPNVPSNTYDCIILTQTLQMIFDTNAAVATLHRILKPGGVVLCTVPGISQIADPVWNSTWYWSFTELAVNRLFDGPFPRESVDVRAFGNVLSATAFLHGMADRELKRQELNVFDPEYPVIVTVAARKGDDVEA
ncbi:methyltransferase domain-containing protein [Rhodococcus globerulus]|uniref:methyltransferase domain-containing protein n=1 Tax=Rhodococcus globerulus TaxID=33008 RepID=UPI0030196610